MNPAVYDYFSGLQERIVSALEVVDRKGFVRDSWQRPEGGGGTTCIVEEGQVFERGGVNLWMRIHARSPGAVRFDVDEASAVRGK